MSKRTYGVLAGVIGSAVGAWWWSRQRQASLTVKDRGRVIFDNTPTAAPLPGEGTV